MQRRFRTFWIEFVGQKVFEDVKCDEYNIEDGRVFG